MPGNEHSVKFAYAKTDNNQLVHISEASRVAKYLCPGCCETMIPVLGETNAKHFRHHTVVCSYESYLHKTAKMAIYHRLLNETVVPLKLPREVECKSEKLKFLAGNHATCKMQIPAFYNLKALFNQVELEQFDSNTGYKPDILLTNSESLAKCYIEIHVTHPCSAEKIASGTPILEFHVASEADITALVHSELSNDDTNLTPYNFKPSNRIVERCLEQCIHAKVELDGWKLSQTGRLQQKTIWYQDVDNLDINLSAAWPKSLLPQEQLIRLRNLIHKAEPKSTNANCVQCEHGSNWDNGFLYCAHKHKTVAYTEARLCAQFREGKLNDKEE